MPRRIAIALAAAALGLLVAANVGWGARKPRPKPVPGAAACLSANKAWARQLRRRRGRALASLRSTVASDSDVNELSDAQVDAAEAMVEAAATPPRGRLSALLGSDWEIADVQALAGPEDPRTGFAPVWGAEVDVDLGGFPRRVDSAVPATIPIPSRPRKLRARFARWRSLGYVPYCVRLRSAAVSDVTIDIDMRSGAARIVAVFPGPNSDDVLTPRLPGQGTLPPGA